MQSIINFIKENKVKTIFAALLLVTYIVMLSTSTPTNTDATKAISNITVEKTASGSSTETAISNAETTDNEVHIFYHPQCPHCHDEFNWIETIKDRYPNLKFIKHNITESGEYEMMKFYADVFGIDKKFLGTPLLIHNNQYKMGFGNAETTGVELLKIFDSSQKKGEKAENKVEEKAAVTPETATPAEASPSTNVEKLKQETVNLPIFGEVSLVETSLPVLSVILGFVDGFNPCAMWVLVFLISIVIELKDRSKIYTLVGTFLVAESVLYFLFMTAWLNFFLFIGYVHAITLTIGVIAIYFGGTSIYDFIKNVMSGGHVECVVDIKTQQKAKTRIKALVEAPLTIATMLGMVALAFVVNSVEFVCSSALPAIFTQVLTLAHLNSVSYYTYMLIYLFFYMIDDFIIFGLAALAINKFMGDKYADISKIIGGVIILALGIMMTFFPDMLR